jgi:hypothetical protein
MRIPTSTCRRRKGSAHLIASVRTKMARLETASEDCGVGRPTERTRFWQSSYSRPTFSGGIQIVPRFLRQTGNSRCLRISVALWLVKDQVADRCSLARLHSSLRNTNTTYNILLRTPTFSKQLRAPDDCYRLGLPLCP